jgi:AcrR family transcriptional regulator
MRKRPMRTDSRARVDLIVEATSRLLEAHALTDLTISMIARTAGIARTTVYDFFPTTFAIFELIARDHVMRSWNSINADIASRGPRDMASLIDASVACAANYFNAQAAARKTLFGTGALELHVIDSDWDILAARMHRNFLRPDWPVEPLSPQDPFRTMSLLMSAIYSASVRRSDRITPDMADEARLISAAYIERREAAFRRPA